MADLETAGAALLLKLKELEGHAHDAREALDEAEDEVQEARQRLTEDGASLVDDANASLEGLSALHERVESEAAPTLQALHDLQEHVTAAEATLREQLEAAVGQTEELGRIFEQQAAELLGTLEAIAQRAHALRDRLQEEGEQLDHALDDVRELLQDDFTHACDAVADDLDLIAARVHEAAKGAHEAIDPLGDDWQAALEQEWEESLHRQGLDTVRSNLHTVVQAAEDAFRHAREAALGELPPAAARVDARAQAIVAGVLEGAEALEAAGTVERESEAAVQRLDRVLTAFEDLQAYLGRFTFG